MKQLPLLQLKAKVQCAQAMQPSGVLLLTFVAWQPLGQQHSSQHIGGASPDLAAVQAAYMLPETHQPPSHYRCQPLPAQASIVSVHGCMPAATGCQSDDNQMLNTSGAITTSNSLPVAMHHSMSRVLSVNSSFQPGLAAGKYACLKLQCHGISNESHLAPHPNCQIYLYDIMHDIRQHYHAITHS